MKILLIFTLYLISDGGDSKKITGYKGETLIIECKYDKEYTQNNKYFCKDSPLGCSDQIRTNAKNELTTRGRFSLYDDTKSAELRVWIVNINVQDDALYYCAVDRSDKEDILSPVHLKVF